MLKKEEIWILVIFWKLWELMKSQKFNKISNWIDQEVSKCKNGQNLEKVARIKKGHQELSHTPAKKGFEGHLYTSKSWPP